MVVDSARFHYHIDLIQSNLFHSGEDNLGARFKNLYTIYKKHKEEDEGINSSFQKLN